jgi:hypothetical protein
MNEPATNLPTRVKVDACFDGTKGMNDFSREVMLPLLMQSLCPSLQEIAVRDTYYKMSLLLRSACAMNHLDHVQSLASLTRTLFEQWLDLKILAQDTTGASVKKYNEFPEIERYRVAEQLVKFSQAHPSTLKVDISWQQAFYDDPQRKLRIGELVEANPKNGKLQYPDHWTKKNVRERAKIIDQERMYVEVYSLLSWYVHAGATGTAGLSDVALDSLFGLCHSRIQRIFVDATSTTAKLMKISSIDNFYNWIDNIYSKTDT